MNDFNEKHSQNYYNCNINDYILVLNRSKPLFEWVIH